MATYNAVRKTLLRCYVGRAGDEAVVEQTEEELVQLVLEDLRKTMDITEDRVYNRKSLERSDASIYSGS